MSKKLSEQEKARRAWVRALRSGKYGWGKNELHPTEKKYCCLGVLCEVAVQRGVIETYDYNTDGVPSAVQKWIGLTSKLGDIARSKYESLADYNDSVTKNPFKRIADLIESKHEGLFREGE